VIQIKPYIDHELISPYSGERLTPKEILWQGTHVCVKGYCSHKNREIVEELKVGHAQTNPYTIDILDGRIWGNEAAKSFLGIPLLYSLQNPNPSSIEIKKEVFNSCRKVIILNCIDFLYGHGLLKLLNAQRHLEECTDLGLVVIVPKYLRWMVPEGVAEIWTVNISLNNGQCYYPKFHDFVQHECERFDEIYISKAHSHPSQFDIEKFTKIDTYDWSDEKIRITFVWREDRPWVSEFLYVVSRKFKVIPWLVRIQNWKVCRLLWLIKKAIPEAQVTIAGLGKKTKFPQWIEDLRVEKYTEETERKVCKVYADSRLVIGIHGSNMLLPSGHAGMTLDLMHKSRWNNFAQDILYQEKDPRLAAFRYRYIPFNTNLIDIASIAVSMIEKFAKFKTAMKN